MTKLTNKELLEHIIPLLQDDNHVVRSWASNALGSILQSDPSLAKDVLEQIIPLLEDDNYNVRSCASKALGFILQAMPALKDEKG